MSRPLQLLHHHRETMLPREPHRASWNGRAVGQNGSLCLEAAWRLLSTALSVANRAHGADREMTMPIPKLNEVPFDVFLERIVKDGIAEVRVAYAGAGRERKLAGAVAGFELMRGRGRGELKALAEEAQARAQSELNDRSDDYWYWRLRAAQAEWVLNVVNAADYANNRETDFPATARGLEKAMAILGAQA